MTYKLDQLTNLRIKISINRCILCVGFLLFGCAKENLKEPITNTNQIEISIQQLGEHQLIVNYQLQHAVTLLDFGPASFQASSNSLSSLSQKPLDWEILEGEAKNSDLAIIIENGRLRLMSNNNEPFQEATLRISPEQGGRVGRYRSIYPFDGDDMGAELVLYTGHFWPYEPSGQRMKAVFNISPIHKDPKASLHRGYVSVHGEQSPALTKWQSPINHPAFIYLGSDTYPDSSASLDFNNGQSFEAHNQKGDTQDEKRLSLIFDDEMPDWIKMASEDITRNVYGWLETGFEHQLELHPSIFVTLRNAPQKGGPQNETIPEIKGFVFEGDALPGQIMVTLTGEAWQQPSKAGREILNRSLTHEMVHLWQTRIRAALHDGEDRVPNWIHEGAADAIAAEALLGVGIWNAAAKEANFNKARAECNYAIAGQTLKALAAKGDIKGVYACGHILALLAVTGSNPAQVLDFWQDFIEQTLAGKEGYSLRSWLALVDERSNTPFLASGLKAFIENPSSLPAAEILRLQSLATNAP